ncbi:PAS domain S-box-containing protein [Algoriphagus boseongensis]|uniref:Sensory/regulatory protein RpfC n=1 Tax=Algoriphagus boseongensis TaxID=1442587 RepID=A0A4R6T6A4_9BACT|nr:PAS domain-containing hybrid sensor histidine kinase/response regulator [Algoriphagus boseongensis]TDQ18658.1 PAS domain S-box-containing protein [Algoriphagus boseongensis]
MNFNYKNRSNFWLITLAGSVLLILVIVLGIGFFNAIYNTQIESRKDFLTQQTALAARGLETEVGRFQTESGSLMKYLIDPDMDPEDFGDELTDYTRRFFNSYPRMLEKIWIDFGDSVLVFSQNERNDFLRNRDRFPVLSDDLDYIFLQDGKFKILYLLNLRSFATDYVANFYLNPGGGKFLLINDTLSSISRGESPYSSNIPDEFLVEVRREVNMGLKGLHEISWLNYEDDPVAGILVQYPFNFSPSKRPTSLVFIVPSESLTSGIYSTFLFTFLVITLLLIGIVEFFVISLRNNLQSEKIREENLKEISALFEQQSLLMRELKGFIFYHDYKGRMIRVSDEVEQILGYPKSDFIKAFNPDNLHPEASFLRDQVIDSLVQKKDLLDLQIDFVRSNSEKIRLRIFSKLIYSPEGRFEGGLGLCTDITEQFKAQEEIVQSEERLRTLIENIPDTIFIYDYEGNVIDFHSQEGKSNWYKIHNPIGKKISDLVPQEQAEELKNAFNYAKTHKNIQTIEVTKIREKGERHLEMRIFPLDENQVMSISKDITGQKIWEKGLVEAMNAADKASRAKSEFLANMSHEIRTPMNGLLGIIDLLEGTKLDKIQRQYVEIIKNSGSSLLNIIRDILDYSKIEAGEIEIETTVFNPLTELNAQVEILSGLAKKKNIQLTLAHNLQEAVFLEGDKNKINQVLLNLISNALKFTPENGLVEVRLDLDDLDENLSFLSYKVKDTGIGISQENLKNLTKPFYQVDSSISRNFQGTGLGLAIAKKIVELLGGELIIESEPEKGSEFSFTILVRKSNEKIEHNESHPLTWKDVKEMGAAFPLKILLAEDNDLNLQLMTLMFEQLGFQFDIAKNGLEALEKVKSSDFDVVLMDVQMPVMNGLDTTRKIREIPGKEDLVIIGLSANVFEEDRKKALQSGMNDYLTKPIRLAILADKLEYYFRKTRENNS